MKKLSLFTLAIAIVFTLIISGSHHVFAADLIQGGQSPKTNTWKILTPTGTI